MATAIEYGLIAAGISLVIVATVNAIWVDKNKPKAPPPPPRVSMLTTQAAAPLFLPEWIVPDVKRMHVWDKRS